MSDLIAISADVGFARIKTRIASGNCGVRESRIGNREGEARAALGGAHAQADRVLVHIADELAAV